MNMYKWTKYEKEISEEISSAILFRDLDEQVNSFKDVFVNDPTDAPFPVDINNIMEDEDSVKLSYFLTCGVLRAYSGIISESELSNEIIIGLLKDGLYSSAAVAMSLRYLYKVKEAVESGDIDTVSNDFIEFVEQANKEVECERYTLASANFGTFESNEMIMMPDFVPDGMLTAQVTSAILSGLLRYPSQKKFPEGYTRDMILKTTFHNVINFARLSYKTAMGWKA